MANQNSNRRFVGNIQTVSGKNGNFEKIIINNPYPNKKDGTPDPYNKGQLFWVDNETGQAYLIKQLGITVPRDGMTANQLEKGFNSYITLDLDSEYHVDVVNNVQS